MQHELIVYWANRKPSSTFFNTKAAAMEEAAKARLAGAIDTKITLVSNGM